jgi:hypothetical protein
VIGFLAAVAIRNAYFAAFGSHKGLALVLEEAVVVSLPQFPVAIAWAYVTVRPWRRVGRQATRCCFGGLAVAWVGWFAQGLFYLEAQVLPGQFPLWTLLLSLLILPVWAILNVLAAPCGVLVGGYLAREARPSALQQPAQQVADLARGA